METNGTLLDRESAGFLRGTGRFGLISVSLDGACPATHDAMRGVEGSFDRAVDGIRVLVSEGFRPQVICTLHEGNVTEVPAVIGLARSLGCGSVKFNHVQTVGRGAGMPGRLPLERLLSLHRDHCVGSGGGDSRGFRVMFDIPPAFRPVGELLESGAGSCRILGILGILSGGEMAMCGIGTAVPELVYGNLSRDTVRDVWFDSPGLLELRRIIPGSIGGICAACIHRDACVGVCAAGSYHRTGRLDSSYWFCEEAAEKGIFPSSRTLAGIGRREES
jgi:SynChlorMet cassette radical SAM/SPASM protein ScmF